MRFHFCCLALFLSVSGICLAEEAVPVVRENLSVEVSVNPTVSLNTKIEPPLRDSALIRLEQYKQRFELSSRKQFPLFELVGLGMAAGGIFFADSAGKPGYVIGGGLIAGVAYLVRDRSDEERVKLIENELEIIKQLKEKYALNKTEEEYYGAVAFRKLALDQKTRRETASIYAFGYAGLGFLLTGKVDVVTAVAGVIGVYNWINLGEIEVDYKNYIENVELPKKPLPL